MTPELLETLKIVITALITGLGGILFGAARRKAELEALIQKNKDSEFARLNKVVDELQEENRGYRNELRDLRADMRSLREQDQAEREGYLRRIQQLESEVLKLRSRLAAATATSGGVLPSTPPTN